VNIDKYGQVSISEQEAFEALYSGKIRTLDNVDVSGDVTQYNQARLLNADRISELKVPKDLSDTSIELFDKENYCDWFMPEEYRKFPMEQWLLNQCSTEEEKTRVNTELKLFIQHGMFDLLSYLKYLVDTMRENKIVWGVGRGSSVASYILYIIGVHRINSIKYNLDINEFLKEN